MASNPLSLVPVQKFIYHGLYLWKEYSIFPKVRASFKKKKILLVTFFTLEDRHSRLWKSVLWKFVVDYRISTINNFLCIFLDFEFIH